MKKLDIYARLDAVNQAKKELADVKAKASLSEFAVAALDAKFGIRKKIIEKALIPLQTVCNQKAASFADLTGYEIINRIELRHKETGKIYK